ncbi:MAG: phospholipase D family protein [Caldimonas sp.]
MPLPRRLLAQLFFLGLGLAVLAGCSTLPPLPERTPSSALTDTAATPLGELARTSLAGAGAGESGFRLLPTGDYAFDARLALVRRAERSLDVQYYQIQRDSIGLKFLRELAAAARRGVRVRILVDDLYTAGEDELFVSLAALPNVELRLFNPLPARSDTMLGRLALSLHEFGRINHRMHNKLFVADNRFAVTGGRNMADEYFMRSASANFIDMDVIAAGPVVNELSSVFDSYWNSIHAYPVQTVVRSGLDRAASERRFDEIVKGAAPDIVPALSDPLGRVSVEVELASGRMPMALARARVFADAPTKIDSASRDASVSTVTRSVLAEFASARSEVVIASPYFIPGPIGMKMMKEAVAQGGRIVVFTNSLGATDEPLVHWRYARYRREMLKLGVTIYELSPDLASRSGEFGTFGKSFGRLHAKVAVIDQSRIFIGSMNLDQRSAWSNTEVGVLIESPALAQASYGLVASARGSVYRLRLAADGETIEWITTAADGKETVLTDEPHNSLLLRLKMWLLEPFASEEML